MACPPWHLPEACFYVWISAGWAGRMPWAVQWLWWAEEMPYPATIRHKKAFETYTKQRSKKKRQRVKQTITTPTLLIKEPRQLPQYIQTHTKHQHTRTDTKQQKYEPERTFSLETKGNHQT